MLVHDQQLRAQIRLPISFHFLFNEEALNPLASRVLRKKTMFPLCLGEVKQTLPQTAFQVGLPEPPNVKLEECYYPAEEGRDYTDNVNGYGSSKPT